MPSNLIKSLAATSGNSIADVEHKWQSAQNIVHKEYKIDKTDPRFWALTTGVTKKMLGIKEALSFRQFLETYGHDNLDQLKAAGFDVTVEYDDEIWYATGKIGTNRKTGAHVAEYSLRTPEGERRIWSDTGGVVYED